MKYALFRMAKTPDSPSEPLFRLGDQETSYPHDVPLFVWDQKHLLSSAWAILTGKNGSLRFEGSFVPVTQHWHIKIPGTTFMSTGDYTVEIHITHTQFGKIHLASGTLRASGFESSPIINLLGRRRKIK